MQLGMKMANSHLLNTVKIDIRNEGLPTGPLLSPVWWIHLEKCEKRTYILEAQAEVPGSICICCKQ